MSVLNSIAMRKFYKESGGYRCIICRKVRNTVRSIQKHFKDKHTVPDVATIGYTN